MNSGIKSLTLRSHCKSSFTIKFKELTLEIANNISKSIDIKTETTKETDPKTEDGENCGKQQFEEVLSKLQDSKSDKTWCKQEK